MTGLWTNDRDTLDQAMMSRVKGSHALADYLIDSGAVRVLDPDDTELVEQVAAVVVEELQLVDANPERLARAVIEALRQP